MKSNKNNLANNIQDNSMKKYSKVYSFWGRRIGAVQWQIINLTAYSKKEVIEFQKLNGFEIENGLKGIKILKINK